MNFSSNKLFHSNHHKYQVPQYLIGSIILLTFLPLVLHLLGVDFGSEYRVSHSTPIKNPGTSAFSNQVIHFLRGSFIHFLLEWWAVGIAIFTAVMALIQYRITGNPVIATIGMALLCAGFIDAFHALAAVQIIEGSASNEDFIPFTWAFSRVFNATILIIGITIILYDNFTIRKRFNRARIVTITSIIFLALSYFLIFISAISPRLPRTQFPDQIITRPYDVLPLILYFFLMIWLIPKLYKKERSYFTVAIFWSMIPAIMTQMHMVFGSLELFDTHFNIAHYLKALSYSIPLVGLAYDYIEAYRMLDIKTIELESANKKLQEANKELEQFAYVASHDLQEPLKTVSMFVNMMEVDHKKNERSNFSQYFAFITDSVNRMSQKIFSLLEYSRIGSKSSLNEVNSEDILKEVLSDLKKSIDESDAKIKVGELPIIQGHKIELQMLFGNLISNALKFVPVRRSPKIEIDCKRRDSSWLFTIKDNGIGIDKKNQEKIFVIFKRLHLEEDYEGTGIGLSHCQKIVSLHGGNIWVESELGQGSTFYFSIPIKN